jgi:hypothetical protein
MPKASQIQDRIQPVRPHDFFHGFDRDSGKLVGIIISALLTHRLWSSNWVREINRCDLSA